MDKQSQIDKFKEAAREAECNTDEKAFEKALKKVARSPSNDKTHSDESE